MDKKRPGMDYSYETVCEKLPQMNYEDLVSFATGIALDLMEKDDAASVSMVCDSLLNTAKSHLEAAEEPTE